MGIKLSGGLICGGCGKPRGLGTHLCSPGRRKPRRDRLAAPRLTWVCDTCHKPRGLAHTCVTKTDFKARKKRHEQRRKAARRAERKKAATHRRREAARRRKAAAAARRQAIKGSSPRPRPPAHDYHTCGDGDCQKYGCTAYREGLDDGTGSGYAAGYAAAQAEGGE